MPTAIVGGPDGQLYAWSSVRIFDFKAFPPLRGHLAATYSWMIIYYLRKGKEYVTDGCI